MTDKCFWFNKGVWEPADNGYFIIDNNDKDMCRMADSCSPGSMGKSEGHCYKWAKDRNSPGEPWVDNGDASLGSCYVLDKTSNYWLPATTKIRYPATSMPGPDYNLVINDVDYDMCKRFDSCEKGGGKLTNDCYKWSMDPNSQGYQWDDKNYQGYQWM